MITVAVNNNLASSKYALQLIQNASIYNGLKLAHIAPNETVVYYNNKKIPLRDYIEQIKLHKHPDLLIVELSKEAMEKAIYENIKFNIALFFEDTSYDRKYLFNRGVLPSKLLNMIKANYYIIPESYHKKNKKYITYGWSDDASVSATSAEIQIDGSLNVQCCIKSCMPTLEGAATTLREFGIEVPFNDVEATLAAVATLIIYGIRLNEN
ncbi:MAG: hypothetical protein J6D39_04565 [Niameybacter sp.]|nr:hypothetical protein [Niameybacter sp.]